MESLALLTHPARSPAPSLGLSSPGTVPTSLQEHRAWTHGHCRLDSRARPRPQRVPMGCGAHGGPRRSRCTEVLEHTAPGPPALSPEPPPPSPWGSIWDRELQPACVSTRAWGHSVPENSPRRKGRGAFHRVMQASTLGAPQNSVPEAPGQRAGWVGAERPLLAGLLCAGRAHTPTRSRVLESEEANGEARRAEGGHSCVLVPR